MKLKEFIKETVGEAMDAIVEFNLEQEQKEKKGQLNPKIFSKDKFEIDLIEFDVAVTVGNKTQGGAQGGINVLALKIGADGKIEQERSDVSRVKFKLGVAWPYASITDVSTLKRGD